MVDFLKANPFVTMEDYKWGLSVPMIRLMIQDNTRVHYMSEKESKMQNARKDMLVMHPLPRVNEIDVDVANRFKNTLNLIYKIVTHLNACFCFFLNVSDKVRGKEKHLK